MNRFKKELRKAGVKLECDYECLPDPDGIQAVTVNSETAVFAVYHTSITMVWCMDRDGSITEIASY